MQTPNDLLNNMATLHVAPRLMPEHLAILFCLIV